jgi:hypothetical protein
MINLFARTLSAEVADDDQPVCKDFIVCQKAQKALEWLTMLHPYYNNWQGTINEEHHG